MPKVVCISVYILITIFLLVNSTAQGAVQIQINTDRPDAIYHVGDQAIFTVQVVSDGLLQNGGQAVWVLSNDGIGTINQGTVSLVGAPFNVTGTLNEAGFIRLSVSAGSASGSGSAGFDPENIQPASLPPDGLAGWWDDQKALLAQIPLDIQLTEDSRSTSDILVYKLSLANINGSRVYGWYCRPRAEGSYPAILSIPGAGVSATSPITSLAVKGFISVNISIHDYPVDSGSSFYQSLEAGSLATYYLQGRSGRETYYFYRVLLGNIRCIDFLTSLSEWDGVNVFVNGSSQGGGLSLLTAGADQRITAVWANVPAFCDQKAILINRAVCWPRMIESSDEADVIITAGYYDAALAAGQIRCPVMICMGFIDFQCPPTPVYAMFNSIASADKTIVPYPKMSHEYLSMEAGDNWAFIQNQIASTSISAAQDRADRLTKWPDAGMRSCMTGNKMYVTYGSGMAAIQFAAPLSGAQTPAVIGIYNVRGECIRIITSGPCQTAVWDGLDRNGLRAGSGAYTAKISDDAGGQNIRFMLAR